MKRVMGEPFSQREIGGAASGTVVARWKHGHASVELSPDGGEHIILGLSGGQFADFQSPGGTARHKTEIGRVSLMPRHEAIIAEIEPADAFHIFLPAQLIELHGDRYTQGIDPLAGAMNPALQRCALEIFVAMHQSLPDCELRLESAVIELANSVPTTSEGGELLRSTGGLAPGALRRVRDLVADRISPDHASPLRLSEMADAARLSVDHFVRMFRHETGATPYFYASQRRFESAMALLAKPKISIGEISDRMGFSSPSHFAAAFRTRLGVSPGGFRSAICD